jgi:hypothetical protein
VTIKSGSNAGIGGVNGPARGDRSAGTHGQLSIQCAHVGGRSSSLCP